MKFNENRYDEYKIPFEGAKDLDENENGKIFYILDCSKVKKSEEKILVWNEKTIDCFPLFDLIIFSQLSKNQYDQLGLKFNPSSSSVPLENHYQFTLYAFNQNKRYEKELLNSMILNIQIEKTQKIKFYKLKFLIKEDFRWEEKKKLLGNIGSKLNLLGKERRIYKIINQTNENVEMNSETGDLFLLKTKLTNENQINVCIESSFY